MKPRLQILLAIGPFLSVLALQGPAWSAEQSDAKEETSKKSSSRTLAQMIEEVRDSINEGWQKLTNPKTVEPARDKVNEGWQKLTDPKTIEPARNKINEAYKGLTDAAAASGSSDKSKKDTQNKKGK